MPSPLIYCWWSVTASVHVCFPYCCVLMNSSMNKVDHTNMQGKGMRKTYWLIGKEGFGKPLPLPPEQTG